MNKLLPIKLRLSAAIVLLLCSVANASVLTTQQFVAIKSRWSELAKQKTRLILEGRYSGRAANSIRLQKCEVLFHPAKDKRLPLITDRKKNIEISGYLKRSGGRYLFIVERHSIRKSDHERVAEARSALRGSKPASFYKLGQDTAAKAEFYEDEQLKLEARSILTEGIHLEQKRLDSNDTQGMRQLAKRVQEFELSDDLRMELLHEATWVQWRQAKKDATRPLDELLKQINSDLPGALKPLKARDEAAASKYMQSPAMTYRKTKGDERNTLHRILCSTIQLEQISRLADPDGRNGYEMAKLVEARIPEFKDLPGVYRQRELAWKSSRLARLNKTEMRQLAKQYQLLGDAKSARNTVVNWLGLLEKQLKPQGAAGLIKMAELYRSELSDQNREVEFLKKAWFELSENGSTEEQETLKQRLNSRSYYFVNGSWVQSNGPNRKMTSASKGVTIGMSGKDVLKTLNGKPTATFRFVSKDKRIEVWNYRDSGLNIRFQKVRGGTLSVTAITAAN